MNKLILTFLTIILNTTLFAQNDLAKNILDQVSLTTELYKNITIEFSFTFVNENQNIKENQKGTLILDNNKFRLEMNAQTIINDGESQWVDGSHLGADSGRGGIGCVHRGVRVVRRRQVRGQKGRRDQIYIDSGCRRGRHHRGYRHRAGARSVELDAC